MCQSVTGRDRLRLCHSITGIGGLTLCHSITGRGGLGLCAILSQGQTVLSQCQHYHVVWIRVEKLVQGRHPLQCVVTPARCLSSVRHVTLQDAPLWNASGNVDENFHISLVCWCGNVWAWRGRSNMTVKKTAWRQDRDLYTWWMRWAGHVALWGTGKSIQDFSGGNWKRETTSKI
jgi:hypothetical protein